MWKKYTARLLVYLNKILNINKDFKKIYMHTGTYVIVT